MKEKTQIKEVSRDEIYEDVFERYVEMFQEELKEMVQDGINFKGLDDMSDKELIEAYKELHCFDKDCKIKIIETKFD